MLLDPVWAAVAAAFLAALLAAWVAVRRAPGAPAGAVDDLRRDLAAFRASLAEELRQGRAEAEARARAAREETGRALRDGFGAAEDGASRLRRELAEAVAQLGAGLRGSLEALSDAQRESVNQAVLRLDGLAEAIDRRFEAMRSEAAEERAQLHAELARRLADLRDLLAQRLDAQGEQSRERLEGVAAVLRRHVAQGAEDGERLRGLVEARLDRLREENGLKLDEMRRTVDEQLHGTLERRLGESFRVVSDQLRAVHESVGKMQELATGVGDLQRVLTNVKTRGNWAEVSLGGLLEEILTPEQFGRNVEVRPGSNERVEYAIRLPGDGHGPCWLPIDAKFPIEDYERLMEASERGDAAGVEAALKGLEARIRAEGRKICEKYVSPPHSTDFGLLFLPTEGLYAEVIRRPGLVNDLQRDCRIVVAGPTVLTAMLSSLRMGFRTLAIQKRSGEVWELLGAVKTEFGKYGEVLDKVKKKLGEATDTLDSVQVRRRAIDRRLRGVETMPEPGAAALLGLPNGAGRHGMVEEEYGA